MHTFGWIVLGLLALLVVGSLVFWGVGLATGHLPLFFARPYPFFFFPLGFLFFILLIFFVVRLVFWGAWGWRGGGGYGRRYYWVDAKEVLRQRYARGEITKEQFDQMSRDLDEHR